MKSPQTIKLLLASLLLAIASIALLAQAASPTPKPSPKASPAPEVNATPQANLSSQAESSGETIAQTPFPSPPTSPSPVPQLYLKSQEFYTAGGKNWVRHQYDVQNKAVYPAALFAPAPNLPPCGANTNSSRTWVDFFDQSGHRLYGFCALGKPADLGDIWFATEEGVVPPSWIYIEINDRQTNTKYKSNLADTTL